MGVRLEKVDGVGRPSVNHDLIMQVGTGRSARMPEESYLSPKRHLLPILDQDLVEMGVAGGDAEPVIDLDEASIGGMPARRHDLSGGGGRDRRAHGALQIDARVHGALAVERVD